MRKPLSGGILKPIMIAIVDYGMGNLGSIKNMLWRLGHESDITRDPDVIASASKIILPGVGAFDRAMENLANYGLIEPLNYAAREVRKPVLGICLGMQLLTEGSEEGVPTPGFGWIAGRTIKFQFEGEQLRLPHMGWNRTIPVRHHPLFEEMHDDPRFYFVHSYRVQCAREEAVIARARYGFEFDAVIGHENVMGTQFHPEKSHKFGLRLLKNFAELEVPWLAPA